MATLTVYPSSVSGSSWSSPSNAAALDGSNAHISMSRNTTYTLTAYFANTLPSDATITSVTVKLRGYKSSSFALATETLNGTTITLGTSESDETVSGGTSFPSSVAFVVLKTNLTSQTVYVDCIWLEIVYTVPASGTGVYKKVNGVWVEATAVYKKINGVWVEQTDTANLI